MKYTFSLIICFVSSVLYSSDLEALLTKSTMFKNKYLTENTRLLKDQSIEILRDDYKIEDKEDLITYIEDLKANGLRNEVVNTLIKHSNKRHTTEVVTRVLNTQESSIASLVVSDHFSIGKLALLGRQAGFISNDLYSELLLYIKPVLLSYTDLPGLYSIGEYLRTGDEVLSSNIYSSLMEVGYKQESSEERSHFNITEEQKSYLEENYPQLIKNNFLKDSNSPKEVYVVKYQFYKAIKQGDLNAIYKIYKTYKPEDELFFNGYSVVHAASIVKGDDYKVLRAILDFGYNPNKVSISGYTPLLILSRYKYQFKKQMLLVKSGAYIDVSFNGETPILLAILSRNDALINLLLDMGVDLSVKYKKDNDIIDAIFSKWSDETGPRILNEFKKQDLLKDHGKYLNLAINSRSKTAFDSIICFYENVDYQYKNESIIQIALTSKVKHRNYKIEKMLNMKPDLTPPAKGGRSLLLQYLLTENRIANSGNKEEFGKFLPILLERSKREDMFYIDESLLLFLSNYGSQEQLNLCLDNYGDYKENEINSYKIGANLKYRGLESIVDRFLNHVTVSDYVQQDGWSLLGIIISYGNYDSQVKKMVDMGFNPNIKGYARKQIFSLLAKYEDYEMMYYLADKGAKIDNPSVVTRFTPWNKVTRDALEAANKLKEMGAIINEN